jgi:predicted 3-demethylubiquinone-9 3-methyltransferase (glyoxalase superfamily)
MSFHTITPCLWFDTQAEEAARFYVSIFEDSGIDEISRFGKEGFEIHGRPEGSVMSVSFRLEGREFTALNGGPQFEFNEAVSFQIFCDTQPELDYFWSKLTEGGQESQCGWLKDKFGLSWQVVPRALISMLQAADAEKSQRVTRVMLQMKKLDLAALERAFEGG